MAGTRLFLQAVILVEIVVVVLWSAYAGFCHNHQHHPDEDDDNVTTGRTDVLCVPLWQRNGIPLLQSTYAEDAVSFVSAQHNMRQHGGQQQTVQFPSLSMAVSSSQEKQLLLQWQMAWEQARMMRFDNESSVQVTVVDDERIAAACRDDTNLQKTSPAAAAAAAAHQVLQDYLLIDCTDMSRGMEEMTSTTLRVSPRWGTTLVNFAKHSSASSVETLAKSLLHNDNDEYRLESMLLHRRPVHFQLAVEQPGPDWKAVVMALEEWLGIDDATIEEDGWPLWCWDRPSTDLSTVTTTLLDTNNLLTRQATSQTQYDNETTAYLVSTKRVQSWIEKNMATIPDDDYSVQPLSVVLYVPNKNGLAVGRRHNGRIEQTSTVSTDEYLFTILNPSNLSSISTSSLFSHIPSLLLQQCIRPQTSMISEVVKRQPDRAISLWDMHMHARRLVRHAYKRAQEEASQTRQFLLRSEWTVPVTRETANRWQQTVFLLEEAALAAEDGDYVSALDLLDESIAGSRSLRSDRALMETIEFPLDQYLAVFAPLLFPLLIPFLVGLIREVKRYKRLTTATKEKVE